MDTQITPQRHTGIGATRYLEICSNTEIQYTETLGHTYLDTHTVTHTSPCTPSDIHTVLHSPLLSYELEIQGKKNLESRKC